MNRLIFYAIISAMVAFVGFSLWNAQYAYRILPVQTSQKLAGDELETWLPFTSPQNTFSAKFPVRPQYASEKTLDPRTKKPLYYDMFVGETLIGNKYMVSTITYPTGSIKDKDIDNLMTRVMHDMVSSNKDNELTDLSKTFFETHHSLDFEVKTPRSYVRTKTFIDGDVIYILSGITTDVTDKEEEYDYFIESFSLITDPQNSIDQSGAAQ